MYFVEQVENSKELFGYDFLNANMSYSSINKIDISIEHWINSKIEKKDTDAIEFGTAVHAYLLDRELFNKTYIISDFKTFRSDAAKNWKLEQQANGFNVITQENMDKLNLIRIGFCQNPEIPRNFDITITGENETLDYTFNGTKGIDYDIEKRFEFTMRKQKVVGYYDYTRKTFTDYDIIVDLKTISDASDDDKLSREIIDRGYYIQKLLYETAYEYHNKKKCIFQLVFIENKAPFGIKIGYCPDEYDETAKMIIFNAIDRYKYFKENYNNPMKYWGYEPRARAFKPPFWWLNKQIKL